MPYTFECIHFVISAEGVATITLNRPEVFNAINTTMLKELKIAIELGDSDDNVKVFVITGQGKGFCAGQDLNSIMKDSDLIPSKMIKKYYNPLVMEMVNSRKAIICKLNGIAAGAGCALAFACDMIVASESASMSQAFVNIGLVPDTGVTYFLPRIVGRLKAFELLTLGQKITAQQALAYGMVNYVFAADMLNQETEKIALHIAKSPLKSIAMIKSMLKQSYQCSLHEILELEAEKQDMAAATEDFQEGVKAFLEKRPPIYQGK
jgi:2-(1,2-epoxy-1,2-dihydrophenyl)acetyl-CoA isomerase